MTITVYSNRIQSCKGRRLDDATNTTDKHSCIKKLVDVNYELPNTEAIPSHFRTPKFQNHKIYQFWQQPHIVSSQDTPPPLPFYINYLSCLQYYTNLKSPKKNSTLWIRILKTTLNTHHFWYWMRRRPSWVETSPSWCCRSKTASQQSIKVFTPYQNGSCCNINIIVYYYNTCVHIIITNQ